MAKFPKGKSGNPKGRPKGIQDRRSRFRELIAVEGEVIIGKIVTLAKKGDKDALKWCLDRLVPPLRSTDQPVKFSWNNNTSLTDMGSNVLRAAATGKISPENAGRIINALAGQARIIETTTFENRIKKLEAIANETTS